MYSIWNTLNSTAQKKVKCTTKIVKIKLNAVNSEITVSNIKEAVQKLKEIDIEVVFIIDSFYVNS